MSANELAITGFTKNRSYFFFSWAFIFIPYLLFFGKYRSIIIFLHFLRYKTRIFNLIS